MRKALANSAHIADAIAALLRPYAEVVVHDLESETVVHIINPFSKRELGEPSLLHEIDFKPSDQTIGPYEKLNWDGRRIKSISSVIRDLEDKAIGVLCINIDVSHFYAAKLAFEALMTIPDEAGQPEALFKEDWHERINVFITQWSAEQGVTLAQMSQRQKKQLVLDLNNSGAFNGKHSATYAARVIGLGRATIYNYLKEQKQKLKS